MNTTELIEALDYIIGSPVPEHGGFDPQAVRTAQAAKDRIAELEKGYSDLHFQLYGLRPEDVKPDVQTESQEPK